MGSWLQMVPGYAPSTVNMYDCYYVVENERVIDVWPVFPRGPGHNGLLAPALTRWPSQVQLGAGGLALI